MFIVLDLETTGLSPHHDTIIEIAFIKIDRNTGDQVDVLHSFVNPNREIPQLISQITNIFKEDVEKAPKFELLRDEIEDFIEGFPLIGHNIKFDISFLESHGIDTSKNPKIDTFFFANFLCYHEKSLNLGYLCEVFHIELTSAHRAIDDTIATGKVFFSLMKKLQSLPEQEKKVVHFFLSQCRDVGMKIIRDEFLGTKYMSNIEELSVFFEENIRKNISTVSRTYQTDDVKNLYDIVSFLDGFEPRKSQEIMMDKVDKSFSLGNKCMIEAPTGIGKTFAYLIPAIKHSLIFGESVYVSTSTKALQDQIFYKDLSFLSENFPHTFSYTKLKGRRNYLSVKQFLDFIELGDKTGPGEISFILKIFLWSIQSSYGELDELDFYGEEYSFLPDIHAGSAFIFDESNIYKDIEFSVIARKKAKNSNIVITNNHILFQDALSEGAILGEVKNLVIDEAHAIEDVVTGALKKSISYDYIVKVLLKIEKKYIKYKLDSLSFVTLKQQLLFDTAELFSLLEGKVFEKFSFSAKYKTLLLKPEDFSQQKEYLLLGEKIYSQIVVLLEDIGKNTKKLQQAFSVEVLQIQGFMETIQQSFIQADFNKYIYYIHHDDAYGTQLFTTVLSPGDFLKQNLWNKLESVILTSATLQMEDNFSYIHTVLQTGDFEVLALESDFNYEKQALLCIPTNLGSVKNNAEVLISFLGDFFRIVQGKTLVLFTAFSMIRGVFSELKIPLEKENIHLLAQSISGSKHKQIENFKKNADSSILLGTDSFWEGIDIPGQDLQYLIIHKIPFPVPTDPIFIARSELFQDSFQQYAIPKAILKLKQGFGRLIRTKKDTGVIVFLDDRIHTTSWGKNFLHAFPQDMKVRYTSSEKLLEIIHKA